MECLFCAIIRGEIPAVKLYEDDHLVVVLDIYPAHPGQVLIIPKEHKTFIWELNKETLHKLFEATAIFAKVIGKLYPSVVIYSPNGPYANQRVPHAAIYIIPRQENDQNKIVMAWQREQLTEEQIKEWKEKIETTLAEVLKDWELTVSSPTANVQPAIQHQNQSIPKNPQVPILNVQNPLAKNKPLPLPAPSVSQAPPAQNNTNTKPQDQNQNQSKKEIHEEIDKKLEIIKKWLKREI